MKKYLYITAVLSFVACIEAQATLPTGNDPFALSIPNLKGGVEMNVGGMLAKPSGSATDSGTTTSGPALGNSTPAGSDAQTGVNGGVGYGIPGSGNDVQVQFNNAH